MIKTHEMLIQELSSYGAAANKVMRMTHSGELIPITRGVYETDPAAPPVALAASIYGPSYVSFEQALYRYGLIPERAVAITSATFEKRRRKEFLNAFGRFTFQDVPSAVFPLGLCVEYEQDRPFRMASPEKAFCDQLYKAHPVGSMRGLRQMLYEDWRMDERGVCSLDCEILLNFAPLYRKTNLRILCEAIRKGKL